MKPGQAVVHLWAILVLSSFLLASCGAKPQSEEPTPTPLPTPVIPTKPTYKVSKGQIIRKSEFTGRIVPQIQQDLYFKTAGRVARVMAVKGDKVKAGQILAELESGTSPVDVRRAQINLEVAKLNKEMAILQGNKYAPEYPIILKMKDYDIEMAQLALDEINAKVNTAQIVAPFDGTIMSSFLEPDLVVEAYKSQAVIADLSKEEVSADLVQSDMAKLQEGLPVQIYPVSGPGTVINGTLSKMPYPYGKASTSSKEKQDNATHVSFIDDPAKDNLGLGDLVRVVVVLEQKDDVLYLPPQAIRKFEGRQFVVVQDNTGQRRVDVKIGVVSDDKIEILDGVTEGQVVVAP